MHEDGKQNHSFPPQSKSITSIKYISRSNREPISYIVPSQLKSSRADAASGTMTATTKIMTKRNRKQLVGETASRRVSLLDGEKTAE